MADGDAVAAATLAAYPRLDWPQGWRVWCSWCSVWHLHGQMEAEREHRVAHCTNPVSPYRRSGYWMKRTEGSPPPPEALPRSMRYSRGKWRAVNQPRRPARGG